MIACMCFFSKEKFFSRRDSSTKALQLLRLFRVLLGSRLDTKYAAVGSLMLRQEGVPVSGVSKRLHMLGEIG